MQASILYKRDTQGLETHVGADEQSIFISAKKVFDDALSATKIEASDKLHDIMTKYFGMYNYLRMQTCRDALNKNEVSFAKFERE